MYMTIVVVFLSETACTWSCQIPSRNNQHSKPHISIFMKWLVEMKSVSHKLSRLQTTQSRCRKNPRHETCEAQKTITVGQAVEIRSLIHMSTSKDITLKLFLWTYFDAFLGNEEIWKQNRKKRELERVLILFGSLLKTTISGSKLATVVLTKVRVLQSRRGARFETSVSAWFCVLVR